MYGRSFSQFLVYKKKIQSFSSSEKIFAVHISTRTRCVNLVLTILDDLTTIVSSVLNGYMNGGPYQEKKGKSVLPSLQPEEDEEIYRFLRKPQLRRENCPNPIPWWGVSDD